jgi:hypothetical protein
VPGWPGWRYGRRVWSGPDLGEGRVVAQDLIPQPDEVLAGVDAQIGRQQLSGVFERVERLPTAAGPVERESDSSRAARTRSSKIRASSCWGSTRST